MGCPTSRRRCETGAAGKLEFDFYSPHVCLMNIVKKPNLTFEPWYSRNQTLGKATEERIAGLDVNENGRLVGRIQPNRSLDHPHVTWKCSTFSRGKEEELLGESETIERAKERAMQPVCLSEWSCEKCGRKLRAFFRSDAVRGEHFQEHTVRCPACGEPKDLIPEPHRLDESTDGGVLEHGLD